MPRLPRPPKRNPGFYESPEGPVYIAGADLISLWLDCLADPKANMARVPDAWPEGTFLFRSVQIFELTADIGSANVTSPGAFFHHVFPETREH